MIFLNLFAFVDISSPMTTKNCGHARRTILIAASIFFRIEDTEVFKAMKLIGQNLNTKYTILRAFIKIIIR